MHKPDCIFCLIAQGKAPHHEVWSSDTHLAFLSIFPNTEGFTVIIPREHYDSYAFEQDNKVLTDLVLATKKVANILDGYFDDVSRCGMFFEGYGVDHLHSKLFPMHGTGSLDQWAQIESGSHNDEYFEKYPGYLSSNSSHRANDAQLAELAEKIRKSHTPQ